MLCVLTVCVLTVCVLTVFVVCSDCVCSDCVCSDCVCSDCACSDCVCSDCACSDCACSDCACSDGACSDGACSDCACSDWGGSRRAYLDLLRRQTLLVLRGLADPLQEGLRTQRGKHDGEELGGRGTHLPYAPPSTQNTLSIKLFDTLSKRSGSPGLRGDGMWD